MGPERGSGSPAVTRPVVSSGLEALVSSMLHHSPGRLAEEPPVLSTFHTRKLGSKRPKLTQDALKMGELGFKPGEDASAVSSAEKPMVKEPRAERERQACHRQ